MKKKNPQDTTLRNHRSLLRKIKLLKEEMEVQRKEVLCLRKIVHRENERTEKLEKEFQKFKRMVEGRTLILMGDMSDETFHELKKRVKQK